MRASGILMHLSSIPSDYGIGTMGRAAFEFVDFLKSAGQKLWQLLPITPTSYGDSPYQSFSTYAGNPYFIDFDLLSEGGLLEKEEYASLDWGADSTTVDYGKLYEQRFIVLKKAFTRFIKNPAPDYAAFKEENKYWLKDYALYMAIKFENKGVSWQEWEKPIRFRQDNALAFQKVSLENEVEFWCFVQHQFFEQFFALKKYANDNGIKLIGDIPIYVALDSADVWANPALFLLDKALKPIEVAGCPPDYFSETGQLWGNPLYDWDYMETTGYDWWIKRIAAAVSRFDAVRIDHFRGFESYYAVPAKDETAANGVWRKGPGLALFDCIREKLGNPAIIAEDLGYITDSVRELLDETGYPGMKVLQFAFNAGQDNAYLPHNFTKNCVCYTGTHDNDTIAGWLENINPEDLLYVTDYMHTEKPDCVYGLIRLALSSCADTVVTTMQDLLELGTEARMNVPSIPQGNWCWRAKKEQFTANLAEKINELTKLYWR